MALKKSEIVQTVHGNHGFHRNRHLSETIKRHMMHIVSMIIFFFVIISSPCRAGSYTFVAVEMPPIHFTGADGRIVGVAAEIIEVVMDSLGHDVSFIILPPKRALKMVFEGKVDGVFSIQKSSDRETQLDYCEQVLVNTKVSIFKLKDREISFDGDLLMLRHLVIGINLGFSYGSKFEEAQPFLNTETSTSLNINFKKLLRNRIDVIIAQDFGPLVGKDIAGFRRITTIEPPVAINSSYLAFSKKKNLKGLRNAFDLQMQSPFIRAFIQKKFQDYQVPKLKKISAGLAFS